MDEQMRLQNRAIELDKEFLMHKERDCILSGQLKEYTTQQGIIGLKVCNIEMEMELLQRKIADIQAEKAHIYNHIAKVRKKKAKK